MFICAFCNHPSSPREPMTRVVTKLASNPYASQILEEKPACPNCAKDAPEPQVVPFSAIKGYTAPKEPNFESDNF